VVRKTLAALEGHSGALAKASASGAMWESGRDGIVVGQYSRARSADEATAKLAHDRVLLHTRGCDGDLTVHRSVTA
jgi:hypothetical protein